MGIWVRRHDYDRFIAGHSSCELRRYLDSVPAETPIREIKRVSKSGPDPIYPTYVVGDSDTTVEDIRVAAVSRPQSTPDQVEHLFRQLLAKAAVPIPVAALGSGSSGAGKVVTASGVRN